MLYSRNLTLLWHILRFFEVAIFLARCVDVPFLVFILLLNHSFLFHRLRYFFRSTLWDVTKTFTQMPTSLCQKDGCVRINLSRRYILLLRSRLDLVLALAQVSKVNPSNFGFTSNLYSGFIATRSLQPVHSTKVNPGSTWVKVTQVDFLLSKRN